MKPVLACVITMGDWYSGLNSLLMIMTMMMMKNVALINDLNRYRRKCAIIQIIERHFWEREADWKGGSDSSLGWIFKTAGTIDWYCVYGTANILFGPGTRWPWANWKGRAEQVCLRIERFLSLNSKTISLPCYWRRPGTLDFGII